MSTAVGPGSANLFSLSAGAPLRELLDLLNDAIDAVSFSQTQGGTTYTGHVEVSVGDDPQTIGLWNNIEAGRNTANRTIDGTLLSGFYTNLLSYYEDPDAAGVGLTRARAREICGFPQTITYYDVGTASWGSTAIYGYGTMRRLRHRRISGPTATADYNGNAATAGQRAWGPSGGLFECVSSGDWADVTGTLPTVDIVDNTQERPNHCEFGVPGTSGYEWNHVTTGGRPLAETGLSGLVCPGDILGWWVFEERRQILELLTTPL